MGLRGKVPFLISHTIKTLLVEIAVNCDCFLACAVSQFWSYEGSLTVAVCSHVLWYLKRHKVAHEWLWWIVNTHQLRLHTHARIHLSSFARNSNQHREHWEPIRCSFLHIGLFDFAFSKQTICPAIAMNIAKKPKSWFGVSSSQEARDMMATIMCSLILTAANGRKTSKWLWAGWWGEGVSDGKHHGTLLVYLNRLELVLSKWSLSEISMSPQ